MIGDPPGIIASGPTAVDESTFSDAKAVLERYSIWPVISTSIVKFIEDGISGINSETLKKEYALIENIHNFIIGITVWH